MSSIVFTPKDKHQAMILMGLPLSGKSTWIEDNVTFDDNIKLVSADDIKEAHPDYDPNRACDLHQYSVKEARKLMDEYSDKKLDIVMDGGGINNNYTIEIIKMLRKKRYTIGLVHIKTPYTVCIERNKNRTRKVPDEDIIYKAIRENAQRHKLSMYVDKIHVVDYFSNKHIFVDMDGVIAALSTLPIINGEIDFVNAEVHKYLKPVHQVISKLRELQFKGHELYILSAIPNSFAYTEKNEWLDRHFNIPIDRRFFVNQGRHKVEMLCNLADKLKLDRKDVTMLDDIHDTLYKVKSRGMNSMHVSEFLAKVFVPINNDKNKKDK